MTSRFDVMAMYAREILFYSKSDPTRAELVFNNLVDYTTIVDDDSAYAPKKEVLAFINSCKDHRDYRSLADLDKVQTLNPNLQLFAIMRILIANVDIASYPAWQRWAVAHENVLF